MEYNTDKAFVKQRNSQKTVLFCAGIGALLLISCGTPRGALHTEARLIQQFQQWEGTPYRLGGYSKSGVDCSSFVQIIMHDAFNITLPGTTREQLEFGRRVSRRSARMGDLVFFQTGHATYHVGIMMREGFFMHASSGKGVTINRLHEPYWQEHLIQIRRITR